MNYILEVEISLSGGKHKELLFIFQIPLTAKSCRESADFCLSLASSYTRGDELLQLVTDMLEKLKYYFLRNHNTDEQNKSILADILSLTDEQI